MLLFAMIVSFKDQVTEDIFDGRRSKAARKRLPEHLWRIAQRKLDQLDAVFSIEELRIPPGNRLEKLGGDRQDTYSIRINDQFRICFHWEEAGPANVEIINYH
jgi:proteic killer suppression protein